MDYQSRITSLQRLLSQSALVDRLEEAVNVFDAGVAAVSSSQTIYDNRVALLFAVLAVEDGHYYEREHNLMKIMMQDELVSIMRRIANEIVETDNLIGSVINLQAIFDRLNYREVSAALDISICYFLFTGGMTSTRYSLLKELFGNY